jgi:biotin synthase-like enzyme
VQNADINVCSGGNFRIGERPTKKATFFCSFGKLEKDPGNVPPNKYQKTGKARCCKTNQ